MKDNLTPEEKLLRLIRKDKKQSAGSEKQPVASTVEAIPKATIISQAPPEKSTVLFFRLQKIIFLAFVASGFYVVYAFVSPWFYAQEFNFSRGIEKAPVELKFKPLPLAKPYEFYLQGIQGRQIFRSTGTATVTPEALSSVHDINLDFIKNIGLVGILSGDNPQAVIEDKKVQKTYYVSKGQFIGEFQVEEIREGKIILNYRGQKFELFL